jgi:molybdopterin molybdotransferase
MKTVEEALAEILALVPTLEEERVDLEAALGRHLACEILSGRTLPPWDNSEMDGYAVRSEDLTAVPCTLRIAGEVAAGRAADVVVAKGTACRIFTGAPMPAGADAVVKQEDVLVEGGLARFDERVRPGQFVRRRGSDVAQGDRVLEAGTPLGAGEIGLLAALGIRTVDVRREPRVGILSTGDELVEPEVTPGPGQIVNSNRFAVAALVRRAGAIARSLGVARDDPDDLASRLGAAGAVDVLLTIGGVSVGERDFVKDVLARLGAEPRFWRVNIKPGKPLLFARWGRTLVFGLPGNPASSMVTFEVFVRPALRKMMGDLHAVRPTVRARLDVAVRKEDDRRHFLRARAYRDADGELRVRPLAKQGSGQLMSMVGVNALVVLDEESRGAESGATVRVWLLESNVA